MIIVKIIYHRHCQKMSSWEEDRKKFGPTKNLGHNSGALDIRFNDSISGSTFRFFFILGPYFFYIDCYLILTVC